jgi:hypothetical protein
MLVKLTVNLSVSLLCGYTIEYDEDDLSFDSRQAIKACLLSYCLKATLTGFE